MYKVIEKCPACGDELIVTRLRCNGCKTEVHGTFQTSLFCKLSTEDLAFAERRSIGMQIDPAALGVSPDPGKSVRFDLLLLTSEQFRQLGREREALTSDFHGRSKEVQPRQGAIMPVDLGQAGHRGGRADRGISQGAAVILEQTAPAQGGFAQVVLGPHALPDP